MNCGSRRGRRLSDSCGGLRRFAAVVSDALPIKPPVARRASSPAHKHCSKGRKTPRFCRVVDRCPRRNRTQTTRFELKNTPAGPKSYTIVYRPHTKVNGCRQIAEFDPSRIWPLARFAAAAASPRAASRCANERRFLGDLERTTNKNTCSLPPATPLGDRQPARFSGQCRSNREQPYRSGPALKTL
jgi:hypothetical protein